MKRLWSMGAALLVLGTGISAGAQKVPAAFAGGKPPTVALVRQLSTGDFFAQWLAGARDEARRLGIKLVVYSADGNDAKQASDLQLAINQKVSAIIVDHGRAPTLAPLLDKAVAAGIKTVTFDVGTSNEKVVQLAQNDFAMGLMVVNKMLTDINGTGSVGLVFAGGFDPLEKRKSVWDAVKRFYPDVKQVGQWGTVSSNTIGEVQSQTNAALLANPNMRAIFAPFDAFALGAMKAVQASKKNVRVYGVDISNADIQAMTAPGSPWVATAATNPADIGRTSVRVAARLIAGEKLPRYVLLEPQLITQDFLRSKKVKTMADLTRALPAFNDSGLLRTAWMQTLYQKNK